MVSRFEEGLSQLSPFSTVFKKAFRKPAAEEQE